MTQITKNAAAKNAEDSSKKRMGPFVYLVASQLLSFAAGSMSFLLTPWIAIELTGQATTAGLIITLTSIPGLILSPVIGSIIDKYGRRRMAFAIEGMIALSSLAIAVMASTTVMNLAVFITLVVIRSAVGSGSPVARKALVPDTARVAKISLERANSIYEAVGAIGFATGPAVAAILITALGSFNTFYVVTAVALAAAVTAFLVRVHEHKEEHDDDIGRNPLQFAAQGFVILFKTPSVLVLMASITLLAVIYLPTEVVLLPKFYNENGNPQALGYLLGIMALFTTVGSLGFEWLSTRVSFPTLLRFAILGVGLSMLPMALLPADWLMLVFGAFLGLAWGPLPPLLNTVIQRKIPANKRGRVFGLEMTVWTAGPMISMTLTGIAVDNYGVAAVYPYLAWAVLGAGILVSVSKSIRDLATAEYN